VRANEAEEQQAGFHRGVVEAEELQIAISSEIRATAFSA